MLGTSIQIKGPGRGGGPGPRTEAGQSWADAEKREMEEL